MSASSSIGRQPCSCEALLDLARLLVGVDVERQLVRAPHSAPISSSQLARAGADGVGGDADGDSGAAQRLDLVQVGGDGRLAHALEPAALVGDVEEHERDARPRRPPRRPRTPRRRRGSGTRRQPCSRRRASRGRPRRRASAPSPGVARSASSSIPSRHVQKSVPAARPRSARWKAWLWLLTKPGRDAGRLTSDDATTSCASLRLREAWTHANRDVSAPVRQIPNALTMLRFAAIPLFVWLLLDERDGPSWWAGIVFGLAGDDRPARRLPRAPLARRVAVRQGRRPARRPADDRHGRRHARRVRPAALGGARSSCSATSCSSAATSSSSRAATSSRSRASARSRRGACTPRSASCSSRRRERGGRSRLFWVGLALAVVAAGQYVLKARREVRLTRRAAREGRESGRGAKSSLEAPKPQAEVDPFATLQLRPSSSRPERQPWNTLPDLQLALRRRAVGAARADRGRRGRDLASSARPARPDRHPPRRADVSACKAQVASGSFETQSADDARAADLRGHGRPARRRHELEPLPDLAELDDATLWAEIQAARAGGGRHLAQPARDARADRHHPRRAREAARGGGEHVDRGRSRARSSAEAE